MRKIIFIWLALFFFITVPILGLKGDLGKVLYILSGAITQTPIINGV